MTLRTTGLIAGVIGVILLMVGFIANSVRPPDAVVAHADVDTSVVVYQSDFMTISPEGQISVEGAGDIVAYTARPADAEVWLSEVDYTEVTSLPDWEILGTRDVAIPSPSPSPEPSGSASPSASPSKSASKSPSPEASPSTSGSASPSPAPSATEEFVSPDGRSTDIWRDSFGGTDRVEIPVQSVPDGLTLIVMSVDQSPLTGTDLSLTRVINDEWITPLLWWGAVLVVAGIIALIVLFLDLRPAQSRGETWIASRKSDAKSDARPGSRRSRRAAGAAIPEASLDEPAPASDDAEEPDPAVPSDDGQAMHDTEPGHIAGTDTDTENGGPHEGPASDTTEDRS